MEPLQIIADDIEFLKAAGVYESVLMYVIMDLPYGSFLYDTLEGLLKQGDKAKFHRAYGDKLPPGEKHIIYRGVSGTQPDLYAQGLSWSLSLERAAWFALKSGLMNPAVYRAEIGRNDIYCFTNARREQEVICRPRQYKKMKLNTQELDRLACCIQNRQFQSVKAASGV